MGKNLLVEFKAPVRLAHAGGSIGGRIAERRHGGKIQFVDRERIVGGDRRREKAVADKTVAHAAEANARIVASAVPSAVAILLSINTVGSFRVREERSRSARISRTAQPSQQKRSEMNQTAGGGARPSKGTRTILAIGALAISSETGPKSFKGGSEKSTTGGRIK